MNYDKAVKAVKAIDWAKRKGVTITEHDCYADRCYTVVEEKGRTYFLQRDANGDWG